MNWYSIFLFELQYRFKRLDTYLFFAAIFLFSTISFNFIFEGQSLGLVKENAPYIIAKTMAIVSGIFMIITSMVMGVPILRDYEHNMTSLLFVNPIKKRDYLLGRYLGSFFVLVLIFSGLIWGMIIGGMMPWRDSANLLPFNFWHYLKPFLFLILPTLFLGGSLFFVSGALSRKMIVVYVQGLLFFLLSILSQSIHNPFLSSILEPLSYAALDQVVQAWSPAQQNSWSIPITGELLINRLLGILLGILALAKGYYSFNFNVVKEGKRSNPIIEEKNNHFPSPPIINIPRFNYSSDIFTNFNQLKAQSIFYCLSILKEPAFWAIVICGVVTIFINSINIGTAYGVNSYPTTFLILEELKELSLFFFLIILVFYPGELIWQERKIKVDEICDALPVSNFTMLASKFIGLLLTFSILLSVLMLTGITFQTIRGYYNYQLDVYFTGLFLEILPFLTLFTFITFFFQVMVNSKFIGHLLVVTFFIITMLLSLSGYGHGLYTFGGIGLEVYSDMNGYGHFIRPYLWFKLYWLAFCIILFVISVIFNIRGKEVKFKNRLRLGKKRLTRPLVYLGFFALSIFILSGSYIFYNTNILNTYYSEADQASFRAEYEKTLKALEYFPQPKIVDVNLHIELYPTDQSYLLTGYYILENKTANSIEEIHIQKALSDDEELVDVNFENGATLNNKHEKYGYSIYKLTAPIQPGDSIRMDFKQTAIAKGFSENKNATHIVSNGTFFDNDRFPGLGYNSSYELGDKKERKEYGLEPRPGMAKRDDSRELANGKSGDDGSKINFEIIIGTEVDQTAIAPGKLLRNWEQEGRSYFHYKMSHPMINFYAIVSARYEILQERIRLGTDSLKKEVDLEIYYHKGHEYNLARMMKSMHNSLEYFNQHFSPYPYQQLRIMEFPRYAQFAQSFPNTVPYSESLGFILDIDDTKDTDIPFFITAHEIAHQWWGLHLVAANVQGRNMIIETLAQYSALMVFKQEYSEDKVKALLQMELERYKEGNKTDSQTESPLALVEKQEYIYYSKGAIQMYKLQEFIGEEQVNLALSEFIKDWNSIDGKLQQERYPTTLDLMGYFKEVTPDSLEYVLGELFEREGLELSEEDASR